MASESVQHDSWIICGMWRRQYITLINNKSSLRSNQVKLSNQNLTQLCVTGITTSN